MVRRPYGKSQNPPSRRRTKRLHKSRRSWLLPRGHKPRPIRRWGVLQGKIKEFDTKLAQALSVIMARHEELAAMKRGIEQAKHDNYDLSFDDI